MDILVIVLTAWKSQEWMAEKKEAIMRNGVRLPNIGAWIEGAGEREREITEIYSILAMIGIFQRCRNPVGMQW